MANYAILKAAIASAIKQNGNNEITGELLQQSLLSMINSLGAGFQLAGIAGPTTNPGTPDQNVFYIAFDSGEYINFGSTIIKDGQIGIFSYNGDWNYNVSNDILLNIRDNDILQSVSKFDLFSNKNLLDESLIVSGFLNTNGTISGSSTYKTSGFIRVKQETTYYYRTQSGGPNMRFVAFYDGDFNYIANSIIENATSFVAPVNAIYVRVTIRSIDDGFVLSDIRENSYPKYSPFIKSEFAPNIAKKNYARTTGNLSNGNSLSLPEYSNTIKKNERIMFSANITSFSSVEIGMRRYSANTKVNRISIDTNNIVVYPYTGSGVSYPHGLTIQNNIQVIMETTSLYGVKITLVSNGVRFQVETQWNRRYLDYAFAESINSTLTECVLSWSCTDFDKDIWMFGDSYFGYTDKWFYYFHQAGYDNNVLMDAYPGEDSSTSLASLKNLLKIGKPQRIIWCLGMNDGGDDSTYPSTAWMNGITELLTICAENNIEAILATIPTVPTVNNERKNYYVRNVFGKQYIDFANAVGAQANGTWFDGMLSTDGVHPTDAGAKALYMAVVTDAPQVMISK